MWDLSGTGIKPILPVLVGRFLTTRPPGKSPFFFFSGLLHFFFPTLLHINWKESDIGHLYYFVHFPVAIKEFWFCQERLYIHYSAAKSPQSCPTLWPHRRQPTRRPRPWDSPGKNTGVGCHFFLQCMKVKSESEVAQSCPTLSGPMDCSLPGSSIHGIFQARVLEWGASAF